jgi:nucleoside phosphorylase
MESLIRMSILRVLYDERHQQLSDSVDSDDLARRLSMSEVNFRNEVKYLLEKGCITSNEFRIGTRIYRRLRITATGIDLVEGAMEERDYSRKRLQPTIGIITALPKEYVAVEVLLENKLDVKVPGQGAGRRYLIGEIPTVRGDSHSVVLSLAEMGNNLAATRATLLLEHFPTVMSIIMTGIAGGIPSPEKPDDNVRLGDIVVSNKMGVIQYDFDKETISETIHRHPPRPPSASLLEAVNLLEAGELRGSRPWQQYIDRASQYLDAKRPPASHDFLSSSLDPSAKLEHPTDPKRRENLPRIFIGPIASSNKLLKNPIRRDQLRDRFGVKAVEMEGSGIADATWNHEKGYLVVRGICDYCDANKGDDWQQYAAIIAAAYTRALIESIPS